MADDVAGSNWSDAENDLIVADYFAMLQAQWSGKEVVKAHRNAALAELTGRSRGSIEFKHCNISAVMERLGLPWLKGYAPRAKFQTSLIDSIARHLVTEGEPVVPVQIRGSALAEERPLWIGPPPLVQAGPAPEPDALRRLVRKFDPAVRDARNRLLGRSGEQLVLDHERKRLIGGDREDLARRVEWTSEVRGDGAGYDIASFDLDGRERLIEVKTTNGPASTPFFLTENERSFSDERPDAFRLMRLHDFADMPAAFELAPPLSNHLALNPLSYRAALL